MRGWPSGPLRPYAGKVSFIFAEGAVDAMELCVTVFLFLVGLLLIVKGGDWFLDGAVWIAETTGVPRFIIGATIVSLATTLPELTVSVTGVLQGEVDLAVGNAVGSVTANIGLILGISVVCIPSAVSKKQFNLKALLMIGGAVLLTVLSRGGALAFLPGLLLFAIFAVYLRGRQGRHGGEPGGTRAARDLPPPDVHEAWPVHRGHHGHRHRFPAAH